MATLIRRSNGYYYIIRTVNNRRFWESTGTQNKAYALRILTQPKESLSPKSTLKLSQFQHQALTYAKANLAPNTVTLYAYAFQTFERLIGDYEMSSYSPQQVEEFKIKRLKEVSPVKVNIDFRTLQAGFSLAVRWDLIPENPFKKCRQLRIPFRRPLYLTIEEYRTLEDAINLIWFKELVRFAVSTMMRLSEILSLQWNSVDLNRRLISIENRDDFRTKTQKSRSLPMDDWVFNLLKTKERKSNLVFTTQNGEALSRYAVSKRLKNYVLNSGINSDIHFHSLRHTGASWLVQHSVPIYTVQKILGHSTIQMTQVYSHLESDHLRKPLSILSNCFEESQ